MLKRVINTITGKQGRLSHIITKVYHRPLLLQPSEFQSIHMLLQSKLGESTIAKPSELKAELEALMEENDANGYEVKDGVAYIPITGVIGSKVSLLEKVCGATDIRDIREMLKAADGDSNVEAICLTINSPGGSCEYIAETADMIASIAQKKKCVAFVDNLMASAGTWLGSAASEIYATPDSTIGSVGVYSAFLDQSLAFANAGLKWEIFQYGQHKTEGMQGTSLSPEYKQIMQDEVDVIGDQFVAWMKQQRPAIKDETLGLALCYSAKDALTLGFIDGIVEYAEECFIK